MVRTSLLALERSWRINDIQVPAALLQKNKATLFDISYLFSTCILTFSRASTAPIPGEDMEYIEV